MIIFWDIYFGILDTEKKDSLSLCYQNITFTDIILSGEQCDSLLLSLSPFHISSEVKIKKEHLQCWIWQWLRGKKPCCMIVLAFQWRLSSTQFNITEKVYFFNSKYIVFFLPLFSLNLIISSSLEILFNHKCKKVIKITC